MAKKAAGAQEELGQVTALVGDIVQDSGKLVSQQLDLLRAEVGDELTRLAVAGGTAAGGAGLVAAGGFMAGLTVAHLLRSATGLPMWACYGLTATGFAAGGAALIKAGRDRIASTEFLPQSAKAAGENLEWLKDRVAQATA